ncbi:hypothetical protein K2173_006498 [Erythroxylum novogranatense]|uniref:Uncharacterized protein n=1 Tax=Erythroxylum novogranatense TaxID=1862640 RepID=A0AAV8SKA2_9ROSI|nr:hypothetical protein K2173_006498 [Erythroxylum novogranatense]
MGSLHHISIQKKELVQDLNGLFNAGLHLEVSDFQALLAQFQVKSNLMDEIKTVQGSDPELAKLRITVQDGEVTEFNMVDGVLRCCDRLCVPDINGLRQKIMHEAHYAPYIKFEHQKPTGLLQELPLPEWKWERIIMDFVIGLPRTSKGHNSIWVIVDRLTKSAHFIAVKTTYSATQLAQLYVDIIVKYHGVPVSIISNR